MPYQQSITPSTDPEADPQSCGDDPFGLDDIPGFLRRTPKPVEPAGAGETLRSLTRSRDDAKSRL